MVLYFYEDLIDKNNIPDDTTEYRCGNNYLTKLPELPGKLERLYGSYNKFTELPELPLGLKFLSCEYNNLVELPELPLSLEVLFCYNNNFVELPELPINLEALDCYNNNIKYLSTHNCQIIKNIELEILYNPVSDNFNSDKEFQDSL